MLDRPACASTCGLPGAEHRCCPCAPPQSWGQGEQARLALAPARNAQIDGRWQHRSITVWQRARAFSIRQAEVPARSSRRLASEEVYTHTHHRHREIGHIAAHREAYRAGVGRPQASASVVGGLHIVLHIAPGSVVSEGRLTYRAAAAALDARRKVR